MFFNVNVFARRKNEVEIENDAKLLQNLKDQIQHLQKQLLEKEEELQVSYTVARRENHVDQYIMRSILHLV